MTSHLLYMSGYHGNQHRYKPVCVCVCSQERREREQQDLEFAKEMAEDDDDSFP